jgi:capsular exopolysaccharide synthesis family protein
MSQIFDALQRSETERPGTDCGTQTTTFAVATELLEAAERKRKGVSVRVEAAEGSDVFGAEAGGTKPLEQFPMLPVTILPASRLVAVNEEGSLGAEKFRFLAVRLRQLRQNRPSLKKVLITSTIPEEGKSTVAANLACTLARRKQHKTLLLEGDLRRPTISDRFGFGKVAGLSQWLRGETESMNVYHLDRLGMWVLPAGTVQENPLELLQSGKLPTLMEQLSSCFDWMVIDSPPLLPLADSSIWARLADGVLLVARNGVTEKRQLRRGLETLESAKLLGAVVNSSLEAAPSDYYQRYGPYSRSAVKGKSA